VFVKCNTGRAAEHVRSGVRSSRTARHAEDRDNFVTGEKFDKVTFNLYMT